MYCTILIYIIQDKGINIKLNLATKLILLFYFNLLFTEKNKEVILVIKMLQTS